MSFVRKLIPCLAVWLVWGTAASSAAQEIEVTEVAEGFLNPSGLAVQPETGLLFVSDSGAGRVVVIDPQQPGSGRALITGFPLDQYGQGPEYKIGPLGLAFVDAQTLAVGGGELPDDEELVRFFDIVAGGGRLGLDQAIATAGPLPKGEDSATGEGNFFGLAAHENHLYVSSNGDDTKGWILRVTMDNGKPGPLEPWVMTKELVERDGPAGMTFDLAGKLLVAQMGELAAEADSILAMYNSEGQIVMKSETGLRDMLAVCYSPGGGHLYALDFSWAAPEEGGLFELQISSEGGKITPKKLAPLVRPTALAFGNDGALYITSFGSAEAGGPQRPGKLVRVTGL